MSSNKRPRAVKIQEFYAHSETINSVSIGRKSSAVLATGADDQLVNIWRLGKTKPIMSLSGHTTEVDCVLFDSQEALVAGGSRGGTIKVWDLAAEKLVRTLPGHRSSVRALDFHPYGEYFASGSQDTNVKIFDVRKKGCMQTYKGHAATVSCVKHSPDGRWIVSGDGNGIVKVWDLTSGKMLNEFKLLAKEKVISVDFHPNEFLLAVGGEHSTTFWDMENFKLISATPRESSAIRSVLFSKDGRALLSASNETLKSWSWEPEALMHFSLDTQWGFNPLGGGGSGSAQVLADMAEGVEPGKEIVGVSRNKTVLSIFVCDISSMPPFDQPMDENSDPVAELTQAASHLSLMETMERVSLVGQTPIPPQPKITQDPVGAAPVPAAGGNPFQQVPLQHQQQQSQPFQPSQQQQQQQQPPQSSPLKTASTNNMTPSASPGKVGRDSILNRPNDGFFDAHSNGIQVVAPNKPNPFVKPTAAELSNAPAQSRQQHHHQQQHHHHQASSAAFTPSPLPALPTVPAVSNNPPPAAAFTPSPQPTAVVDQATSMSHHRQPTVPLAAAANLQPAQTHQLQSQLPPNRFPTTNTDVANSSTSPSLPSPSNNATAATSSSSSAASAPAPADALDAQRKRVLNEHSVMVKILQSRLESLKSLQSLWNSNQARRAVDELIKGKDLAVAVDFLSFAEASFQTGNLLTLDMTRDLLPLCKQLISSKFESYAMVGLKYIRMFLIHFTSVIHSCRSAGSVGKGVDLTRDERVARANDCFDLFKSIYDSSIAPIAKRTSALGELARDTRTHLEKLLWTSPK